MLGIASRMVPRALSGAPVGTMDIGNMAMSAMLGQGEGWVEMGMSGGPGVAGQANAASNSIGGAVMTYMITIIGMNPPPGGSKAGKTDGPSRGISGHARGRDDMADTGRRMWTGGNTGEGSGQIASRSGALENTGDRER